MQRQIARSLIQADGSGLHLRRDLHGEPGQIVTADTHFIDFRVDFVRARNHLHAAIDSVGVVDGQPHRGDIGTPLPGRLTVRWDMIRMRSGPSTLFQHSNP